MDEGQNADTDAPARPSAGVEPPLTFEEGRVLGSLLEKQMATPDYYPLTLNALIAACNQTSNREPVVAFEEKTVNDTLNSLRQRHLAAMVHLAASRVPKYKHLLDEFFPGLSSAEFAPLAVMLLRGPQSLAELRTRTERLHRYTETAPLETSLTRLVEYGNGPLTVFLPAGGGRRVATYAHLLSGSPAPATAITPGAAAVVPPPPDRLAAVESDLAQLRAEIERLNARLAQLEQALSAKLGELNSLSPAS